MPPRVDADSGTLVQLQNVSKYFLTSNGGVVHAVDSFSLDIAKGECLALIGESGSGKSTIGRLLLGLEKPDQGAVVIGGKDLRFASRRGMKDLRRALTTVFQEPYESLNPKRRVKELIAMPLRIHYPRMSAAAREREVVRVCQATRLPTGLLDRFPNQLSGGQQQRVGIARALVTSPAMVVLDEPTAALDASVRLKILALLGRLQEEENLTYLLITHDMESVAALAHRVAVIYRGRLVEVGDRNQVLDKPAHPYTQLLSASVLSIPGADDAGGEGPSIDPPVRHDAVTAKTPTDGCAFRPRCTWATAECAEGAVPLHTVVSGQQVACHHAA